MNKELKIYADGPNFEQLKAWANDPKISGFTTNPTLLRNLGYGGDYEKACRSLLELAGGKPISFEVIADTFDDMRRQALLISKWGTNVSVKIPVINTKGVYNTSLIYDLQQLGMSVNVTAVFTWQQIVDTVHALRKCSAPCIISIFAGRIFDAGIDPTELFKRASFMVDDIGLKSGSNNISLLWASSRQLYDVVLAEMSSADIITLSPALINKLSIIGKDLGEYSKETVEMFFRDAQAAQFTL